jgi:signal transduction histidine kinase
MEAVGQLTGGLAHDFNNLLASISGNLELMRIRTDQGRTAEINRYIEVAMSSVNRATALTHRLLAFSRRQALDPKPTDVNRLVSDMEELFRRSAGPGVEVEIKLASGLWPALCDPNQLENALLNLIINARDAMPDGGHLLIETANSVFPDWRSPQGEPPEKVPAGEYMGLFVTDTGVGMSPEVIARAFDPFFTTKPIGQGTGLGLSMIYGFVQQSGGYVLLSSDQGHGTMVSIYLPRHFGRPIGREAVDAAASPTHAEAGAVVLLVEDELALRMIIVEVLSDLGYTVLAGGRQQPIRAANRGRRYAHRPPRN